MKSKIVAGVGLFLLFVAFFFFPQANALAPHTEEQCKVHAQVAYISKMIAEKQPEVHEAFLNDFIVYYNSGQDPIQEYGTLQEFEVIINIAWVFDGAPEEAAGAIYNRCISHEDMS